MRTSVFAYSQSTVLSTPQKKMNGEILVIILYIFNNFKALEG